MSMCHTMMSRNMKVASLWLTLFLLLLFPCHDLWVLTYQVPRGCFGDTTDRGTPSNPAFFKVSVVSSSHIL